MNQKELYLKQIADEWEVSFGERNIKTPFKEEAYFIYTLFNQFVPPLEKQTKERCIYCGMPLHEPLLLKEASICNECHFRLNIPEKYHEWLYFLYRIFQKEMKTRNHLYFTVHNQSTEDEFEKEVPFVYKDLKQALFMKATKDKNNIFLHFDYANFQPLVVIDRFKESFQFDEETILYHLLSIAGGINDFEMFKEYARSLTVVFYLIFKNRREYFLRM